MQLFSRIIRAAPLGVLLVLLLPEMVQAQSNPTNDSENALTFTTESIPLVDHCFDFSSLFGGNSSQGFVNQTKNLGPGLHGEPGIHWRLFNAQDFDPQANYSRVLYRQHVTNPPSDEYKPSHYADRMVTLYGGPNCTQKNPADDRSLLPWYGLSCWSEDQGSCGDLGYRIASFSLQAKPDEKAQHGTCWVFAKEGAAARTRSSAQFLVSTVLIVAWLAV
ncbi:hypothetical protein V8F20_001845 [Naviculisporaceae sp. PSN 640]